MFCSLMTLPVVNKVLIYLLLFKLLVHYSVFVSGLTHLQIETFFVVARPIIISIISPLRLYY